MRILVTGASGQLGTALVREIEQRGHEPFGVDIGTMDITNMQSVEVTMSAICPDAVIHCAAWTAVDAAEKTENKEKVWKINVDGTANLAHMCKRLGSKMLLISTDYVFNGTGEKAWEPDDQRDPLNIYGVTKYHGERIVEQELQKYFILRTSWVFGLNGQNFVKTMLSSVKTQSELRVVCDQIGTPTYTDDLCRLLVDMVETEKYGIYHATNSGGYISWYEFAKEILYQASCLGYEKCKDVVVIPVTSDQYTSTAKRPNNSRLSKAKLSETGFAQLPDWREALYLFLKEYLKE